MNTHLDPIALLQQQLARLPLVAILRGLTPSEAPTIGQALASAGWGLLEVPLNSPKPLESIALLAAQHPQLLVGAGTVLRASEVREVQAAGGRLIVSPHVDAEVVREAVRLGLACVPGVATPSEAFAALAAGAVALARKSLGALDEIRTAGSLPTGIEDAVASVKASFLASGSPSAVRARPWQSLTGVCASSTPQPGTTRYLKSPWPSTSGEEAWAKARPTAPYQAPASRAFLRRARRVSVTAYFFRTRRRWFSESPTKTEPSASTQMPCGRARPHLSGSPSGPSPFSPVPQMSSNVPFFTSTMRTLWLSVSAR